MSWKSWISKLKFWNNKIAKNNPLKKWGIAALFLASSGVIAGSTYSIVTKFQVGGDYVSGYSGRIQLNPFNEAFSSSGDNQSLKFAKVNVEGKEYDFNTPSVLDHAISQAANAINSFDTSQGQRNFFINYSNTNSVENNNATRLINLYFQAEALPQIDNADPLTKNTVKKVDFNLNNAWFKFVRLNRLSIDRYGFDYNNEGTSITGDSSQPKIETIVPFDNVGTTHMQLLTAGANQYDGVQFNIYSKDISADQLKALANKDANKYQIPQQFKDKVDNAWDVWLDKDLLAIKLNYVYQTYIFNQSDVWSLSQISSVIGNPTTGAQTTIQKERYQAARSNYYALSADEKKFAEDYLKIIVQGNTGTPAWSEAANRAATDTRFIKPDDLNLIYNEFKKNSGDTKLFDGFLLNRITGGESGNWQSFFPKYNTALTKDYKEKPADDRTFLPIRALNSNNKVIDTPPTDATVKEYVPTENYLRLNVDSALSPGISNQELFNRLTKYSVRFLGLRNQVLTQDLNSTYRVSTVWPTGVYSVEPLNSSLEMAHISRAPPLAGAVANPLSHVNNWLWYLIATLIFLLLVGIIVAVLYRVPGVLAYFFWLTSQFASIAAFFALQLELTTDSMTGILASLIISLAILFYGLNQFHQQVKSGNSLRQSMLITLRKANIFGFDISLISFTVGILFAFVAFLELRGFGLTLSIGSFMSLFVFSIWAFITNWLLAETTYHKPLLFLPSKYLVYLKSITGEINLENIHLAERVLSNKYKKQKENQFGKEFVFNLFDWKVLLFLAVIIVVFIVGIILIFIPQVGFGSSFILKDGFLINYTINSQTIQGNKQIAEVQAALAPSEIQKILGVNLIQDLLGSQPNNFFLRTTAVFNNVALLNLFKTFLQPNSYSIQSTTAFSSQLLLHNGFQIMALGLLCVSAYYILRFNWVSLFQVWFSTFLSVGFVLAVVAIIRITVDRNILHALLLVFIFALSLNTWVLSIYRNEWMKKHHYSKKELNSIVYKALKRHWWGFSWFLILFLALGVLGAGFNWFQVQYQFIYLIIGLITTTLIVVTIGAVSWTFLTYLRQMLFYKTSANQEDTRLTVRYQLRNHDRTDEQLIIGINQF